MSLVIDNNDKNYINFNLQSTDEYLLTTAYANSFRRILMTSIKCLGFKYIPYKHTDNYIVINENTSTTIHNDKLSKRLSLLTINTTSIKFLVLLYLIKENLLPENIDLNNIKTHLKIYNIQKYLDKIKFKINVSNTSKEPKFVNTDMIDIYLNDINLIDFDISILTEQHYKLFEYFNMTSLMEMLINNDMGKFIESLRNIVFNHMELTNFKINDTIFTSKFYPKLITELKHNDKLNVEMVLSYGVASEDATWDVLSTISYNFEKDYELINYNLKDMTTEVDEKLKEYNYETSRWENPEKFVITNELINDRNEIQDLELRKLIKEKDLIIQRYNIHDSYRVYKKNNKNIPAQFNFEYKYEGVLNNKKVLYKGFKELNKQITNFKNLFKNINHTPYQDNHIQAMYSNILEDAVDIYITKSTHTIMNLVNDYLYYLIVDKNPTYYTAYMRTHKLSDKYLLRVICNNYKEDIIKICDYLILLTKNIIVNF